MVGFLLMMDVAELVHFGDKWWDDSCRCGRSDGLVQS